MSPSAPELKGAPTGPPAPETSSALRVALIIAFGGMLAILLLAGLDAVRLLHALQLENRVLRDASVERSHRLESISSFVALSNTYFGDYLLDPDQVRSITHRSRLQDTWTRMQTTLSGYKATTQDEQNLISELQQLLEEQRQQMAQVMSQPTDRRPRTAASFYGEQVLPLRTSVIQITARVEDIDSRQIASTESQIGQQFAALGHRLAVVLDIALGAALLLAAGSLAYILRIEKQSRGRYQEVQQARGELERLSARLVAAHEDERRSISRELHDEVGQTLSAVLVDTANLAKRIPEDDTLARRYLDSIRSHADSSVNSIRDIALLLRPSMLDDLGLIPALEWQAREVSRRSDLKVKVVAEDVPDSLNDSVRTCVYRLVQEALHNVSRHSQASHATVTVRRSDGSLKLAVEDDGKGFDPARTRGLGLLGMEERVKQLGGQLRIQSQPGKGTILEAVLPLSVQFTR